MIKTLYTRYFIKRLHNLKNAGSKNENQVADYLNFFSKKKTEYEWVETSCICKELNKNFTNNDITIGKYDRYCLDFETVMCQNCGHIRAKNYPKDKHLEDFYSAHYRRLMHKDIIDKENYTSIIFNSDREASVRRHKFIFENFDIKKNDKELFILDFGGGSGGNLANLTNKGKLLLYDYDTQFYEIAKKHNIDIFKGTLSELKKNYPKPDLIILSHVVEHWPNFVEMIEKIKTLCSNETNIYIEVPDIESSHYSDPTHCFTYCADSLKYVLQRNNFEILYIGTHKIFGTTNKNIPRRNFQHNLHCLARKNLKEKFNEFPNHGMKIYLKSKKNHSRIFNKYLFNKIKDLFKNFLDLLFLFISKNINYFSAKLSIDFYEKIKIIFSKLINKFK